MRAGSLNRRVAIESRASGPDTWGQQTTTWSSLLSSVPAAIDPLAGRELELAQALNSEITTRITVRYHPQLANPAAVAALRVVYTNAGGTRYFNVQAARNLDERNRDIELLASEGLNHG